jgi:hypothetical protein
MVVLEEMVVLKEDQGEIVNMGQVVEEVVEEEDSPMEMQDLQETRVIQEIQ